MSDLFTLGVAMLITFALFSYFIMGVLMILLIRGYGRPSIKMLGLAFAAWAISFITFPLLLVVLDSRGEDHTAYWRPPITR